MKRHIRTGILGFLFVLWSSIALGLPYSGLYVFGDSLSDQGNFYAASQHTVPPPEYTDGTTSGRFTNGRNYVDYLAPMLGLTVGPSFLGGTNYAVGGARTGYHPQGLPSLLTQRDLFVNGLQGGNADPGALYVVWAGANDLKDYILPPRTGRPNLNQSAQNVAQVVSDLVGKGARNILVPNIPDLGAVPLVTGGGPPNQQVSFLTAGFNLLVDGDLSSIQGANLMRLDTFSFVDQIYKNGLDFGLNNVTDACYSKFVEAGGTIAGNPDTYLSWDGFHPTTAAHLLLADQVYARVVPEPATLALLATGIAGLTLVRLRKRTAR